MPRFLIQQPDGKWAQFSTIVDAFTFTDATEEDVISDARQEAAKEAERVTRESLEHVKITQRSYPSGAYSYEDCAATDKETRERNEGGKEP